MGTPESSMRPWTISFVWAVSGGDQLLTWRTMLKLTASKNGYSLVGEMIDVRGALADTGTPLGTDDINTLEPQQAYVGWKGTTSAGDGLDLRFGRQTMNLGSRRFIARNVFRSTINAFNGIRTAGNDRTA